MSLLALTLPCLSLKPRVRFEEDRLEVRTSLLLQALLLFSWCRTVEADARRRSIRIRTRRFWWLVREREIPFDRVEYIDYSFDALRADWEPFGPTGQVEIFTVSLVCRDPRETVRFATFRGEGAVPVGLRGYLYDRESGIDLEGDQEPASLQVVEVLRDMLGVPVGSPLPHLSDRRGRRYRCSACGRNCPPTKSRCIYCGARVEVVPPEKPSESP